MPPNIKAIGTLKTLNIGGLTITGAGVDGEYGTEDDGPTLKLVLSLEKQSVVVSGKASFLDFSTNVDLFIKPDKFYFDSSVKFLNAFDMSVHAESVKREDDKLDFEITGKLKDDLAEVLEKKALKAIESIDEATESIEKELEKSESKIQKAVNNLSKIEEKVRKTEEKINAEKTKLNKLKKWYKRLPKGPSWRKPRRASKLTKAVEYNAKKATLKVKIATLEAARKVALGQVKAAKLALKTVKKVVKATKKGVSKIDTKKIKLVTKKAAKAITKTAKILRIKKAIFYASLQDALEGKFPKLEMDLNIFGKTKHISLDNSCNSQNSWHGLLFSSIFFSSKDVDKTAALADIFISDAGPDPIFFTGKSR